MREERQRLILEGLPKGSDQLRNKAFLDKIRATMEEELSGYLIGKSGFTAHSIIFTLELAVAKNPKLETYVEGDQTVLGLPFKYLEVEHDINYKGTYFEHERDGGKFITFYPFGDKYTEEEYKKVMKYPETFVSMAYKDLQSILYTLTMTVKYDFKLSDSWYEGNKRRDILPILSFNFKKGEVTFADATAPFDASTPMRKFVRYMSKSIENTDQLEISNEFELKGKGKQRVRIRNFEDSPF